MTPRADPEQSRGGAGRTPDAEAHLAERRLLGLAAAAGALALAIVGTIVLLARL